MQKVIIKILLVVALIVLAVVIYNRSKGAISDTATRIIHGAQGDNVNKSISNDRKTQLEELAQELREFIYSWDNTGIEVLLSIINKLPDNEFRYLVEYYNKFIGEGGNTLYYDLDWEILPFTDEDDELLSRIKRMNLKA